MKTRKSLAVFTAMLLLGSGAAHAQDDGLSEILMDLLPPNAATPDSMTKQIELPPVVREMDNPAEESSAAGRNKDGMVQGLTTADDARTRGEEFGQDMADNASQNRESFSRGNRPEPPGPPEPPSPPEPGQP